MTHSNDDLQLVKSFVTKGAKVPDDVLERMDQTRFFALVTGALAVAVEKKFQPDGDSRLIPLYVKELQRRFGSAGDDIKPMVAEAVIRGMLGESELLNEIEPNDAVSMSTLITYAIISEQRPGPAEVEDFSRQAIARADSFQAG